MHFAKAIKLSHDGRDRLDRAGERNPEPGSRPAVKGDRVAAIQKSDV
jgi:hypothetical protein